MRVIHFVLAVIGLTVFVTLASRPQKDRRR